MMNYSNWNDYRHPKFLQSLDLTLDELKILNLFLKRPNFRIDANQEQIQKTTLVSPRRSLDSSKLLSQENASIKV